MGTDFLGRTKKTIFKRIDMQRVALGPPDLFTVKPSDCPRSYVATLVDGFKLTDGEHLIAEVRNDNVNICRGNDVVATLDRPPSEVISAIKNSGGAANGVVQRVHKLSGKAEVTLC